MNMDLYKFTRNNESGCAILFHLQKGDILNKQTKTMAQRTLEFKMTKALKFSPSDTPLTIQHDEWMSGLTTLEEHNYVFIIMER